MRRVVLAFSIGLIGCSVPAPLPLRDEPKLFNYAESKVPSYVLPDPLRFADGRPVQTPAEWRKRRAEIIWLFETHVYGRAPGAPSAPRTVPRSEVSDALGGLATRREVSILFTGAEDGPRMELLMYLPNRTTGPVPVMLGLNFQGNHSVDPDPGIRLSTSWIRKGRKGVVGNRATEASRGAISKSWPIETAIRRGYAVATLYYGDLDPDFDDGFQNGVHAHYGRPAADEWGMLAAWSWGLRRAVDHLVTLKEIDAHKIVVLGHSRLGKAALWAGALDERIAITVSNNSGKGGASLWMRDYGETAAWANKHEPVRFNANFHRYGRDPQALPVDAHMLIALMAPRPVYVASATEDRWADPRGEFLGAKGAEPVYALYGLKGLGVAEPPSPDTPVGDFIGYHLRTGRHALTRYDWERYMDFASRHFGRDR